MYPLFLDFIHSLSWSHPSWDLFILLFLVVGTLVYGFSLGRGRTIMIMVAVYMAVAAVHTLPALPQMGAIVQLSNGFVLRVGTFLGLFAILFFMLTRSALNHALNSDGPMGSWWHIIVLSFLQVGMLISVVMSFLPSMWLLKISPFLQLIFASPWGAFAWVIAPIIGLLVVGMSTESSFGKNRNY
ncbi:MAG: hypothetical protein NT003_04285 [Candidatus Magasanikbacteria bacterium]|nr:hypothetical protein [Candidatus Magasanikbacteria bacterium]